MLTCHRRAHADGAAVRSFQEAFLFQHRQVFSDCRVADPEMLRKLGDAHLALGWLQYGQCTLGVHRGTRSLVPLRWRLDLGSLATFP